MRKNAFRPTSDNRDYVLESVNAPYSSKTFEPVRGLMASLPAGNQVVWTDSALSLTCAPSVFLATGFTTAWPPNKVILNLTILVDLDLETKLITQGGPTFAAITSRSYHPGGVNTLLGDGSVRFTKSTIDGNAWRALGTVAGGEVISPDSY
jgi:prepilin-type processing-associated H-X9-DG protein